VNNVDWTIYAQYVNSTSLRSLIDTFNASVAPEDWIDTFYDLVFNIETCGDYGLMCWGKIVDVERLLTVTPSQQFLGLAKRPAPRQNSPTRNPLTRHLSIPACRTRTLWS
jgi:hypothetical protein